MKFFAAVLVYLVIALVLAWGIVLLVHGNPWVLAVGLLSYSAGVGVIGCLPKKSH